MVYRFLRFEKCVCWCVWYLNCSRAFHKYKPIIPLETCSFIGNMRSLDVQLNRFCLPKNSHPHQPTYNCSHFCWLINASYYRLDLSFILHCTKYVRTHHFYCRSLKERKVQKLLILSINSNNIVGLREMNIRQGRKLTITH